jgi:hypothetical protein
MSLYLQRLLDRAAGLAADAAPVAPAAPLPISNSPIVGYDQRLANPELAADFTVLGASPEADFVGDEEAKQELPLSAPRRDAAERASAVAPAHEPAAASSGGEERRPAMPHDRQARVEASPQDGQRIPEHVVAPQPAGGALQAAPIAAEPAPAPAVAPQTVERPPVPALPPVRPAEGQPRAEAWSAPLAQPVSERSTPAPLAADEKGWAQAVPTAVPPPVGAPVIPVAVPATPASTAPAAAATQSAAEHVRRAAAEPILATPQPLPVPPAALQAEDVVRIVRETVRAERAAETPAPPAPRAGGNDGAADTQAAQEAPRPATAAEASLIGKLESSRYRPMLFGVRRR